MSKILIIEDNQDIRENIEELLSLHDYDTSVANNGETGIEKALSEHPQLILCDVTMPKKNGFEVLEILRKNPDTSQTPFVFITSKAQEKDIVKGRLSGADAYITKPFQSEELLGVIEGFLH
jgi:DNA-binding response OmpR family regulator